MSVTSEIVLTVFVYHSFIDSNTLSKLCILCFNTKAIIVCFKKNKLVSCLCSVRNNISPTPSHVLIQLNLVQYSPKSSNNQQQDLIRAGPWIHQPWHIHWPSSSNVQPAVEASWPHGRPHGHSQRGQMRRGRPGWRSPYPWAWVASTPTGRSGPVSARTPPARRPAPGDSYFPPARRDGDGSDVTAVRAAPSPPPPPPSLPRKVKLSQSVCRRRRSHKWRRGVRRTIRTRRRVVRACCVVIVSVCESKLFWNGGPDVVCFCVSVTFLDFIHHSLQKV